MHILSSTISICSTGGSLTSYEPLPQVDSLNDLPDDILRLIASNLSSLTDANSGQGWGGMNAMRLVCKRLTTVVESCATKLTNQLTWNGPDSLPLAILQKFRRIEHISCLSHNLRNLEGCPYGLKSLDINGRPLDSASLETIKGCTELESLIIRDTRSISDLSPLGHFTKIKRLQINQFQGKDLSPLSSLLLLEELGLFNCPFIESLSPLSGLQNLRMLNCYQYKTPLTVSLLPLVACANLKHLQLNTRSIDIDFIKKMLTNVHIC